LPDPPVRRGLPGEPGGPTVQVQKAHLGAYLDALRA